MGINALAFPSSTMAIKNKQTKLPKEFLNTSLPGGHRPNSFESGGTHFGPL